MPNLLGFLTFTFFPVVFSFCMAFTNWTLKPAVPLEFVGWRNFGDLLGLIAVREASGGPAVAYVASAVVLVGAVVGTFWAAVGGWAGRRWGGLILASMGLGMMVGGTASGAQHGVHVTGFVAFIGGLAMVMSYENSWRVGWGTLPPALVLAGVVGLWLSGKFLWTVYEPRDFRFWKYFYNTAYLMLGMPLSIGGSLGLALLLNHDLLPARAWGVRLVGGLLCLVLGGLTVVWVWGLGYPNAAVLGGVFWLFAAAGIGFGVVTFRTVFYLPTFTSGVALMILWKTVYNPVQGPLNQGLSAIFRALGLAIEPPRWLASVSWAKPALMLMSVWTAIGGTNMLLYLAALSNVPQDLLDAASVDGAGRWARFRHVTWPQLAPTTFFIVVMSVIGGLQGGFDQAYVMTRGGPNGATTTLAYYIYSLAFEQLEFGKACAVAWILFAIIFVVTTLNWRFGKELASEL